MSKNIRVRTHKSESLMDLQIQVNKDLMRMEECGYELIKTTFGNSFEMDYDEGYYYTPVYTAVIEYAMVMGNRKEGEKND